MVVANRAVVSRPFPQSRPEVKRQTRTRPGTSVQAPGRIIAALFVVALALLVVFQSGQIQKTNMLNQRMERSLSAVHDEQRHLQITISQLSNIERLERIGFELGLMYPAPEQIIYLSKHD